MGDLNDKRKRARDDSADPGINSPESKLSRGEPGYDANSPMDQLERVDSDESCINSDNSEALEPGSPEAKLSEDDLFNILNDADNEADREGTIQGLEYVIQSLQEEISAPAPAVEHTSNSGEQQPDLGYLLEASDDELGIPPTVTSREEGKEEASRITTEVDGFTGFFGFEDDMPGYGYLEFGLGSESESRAGEFVALGGLFDYADPADGLWRPESSLQAS